MNNQNAQQEGRTLSAETATIKDLIEVNNSLKLSFNESRPRLEDAPLLLDAVKILNFVNLVLERLKSESMDTESMDKSKPFVAPTITNTVSQPAKEVINPVAFVNNISL
jgi:hypothetical protein